MNTKKHTIYFDANASTPISPRALERFLEISKDCFANPSSITGPGRSAKNVISESRKMIANFLRCEKEEIVFTSGGTESIATLVHGISGERKGQIVTTQIEHKCVLESVKQTGKTVTYAPVDDQGNVDIVELEKILKKETSLLVFSLVNGEIGTIVSYEEIARLAKQYNTPFILDGVAALGKMPINIVEGVSAIAFSGHKCHGPKGSGFFYLKDTTPFSSYLKGGSQEMQKRGGTENTAAIASLAIAICEIHADVYSKLEKLRDYFEQKLLQVFPHSLINGKKNRISNTSNVFINDVEGDLLIMHLDRHGICASLGSACSSGSIEPSHVLTHIKGSAKYASSCLRFSFHKHNTFEEIDEVIRILTEYQKNTKIY